VRTPARFQGPTLPQAQAVASHVYRADATSRCTELFMRLIDNRKLHGANAFD